MDLVCTFAYLVCVRMGRVGHRVGCPVRTKWTWYMLNVCVCPVRTKWTSVYVSRPSCGLSRAY